MGRITTSVCKLCRREGVKLYLKGTRCESSKCAIERRNKAPGMHGARRSKPSEYGTRLREKQKLKRFYGLLDRQFSRQFADASRATGNTGEQLLSLMERRLDNVVYRLGWAPSRATARQIVAHGHVRVNGQKVDRPSYVIAVGDTITIKEKTQKLIRDNMESMAGHQVPGWLEVNPAELTAKVTSLPTSDQIPFDVNTNLIIEFYR